ncbi:hypothetical protein C8Q74DRAFT_1256335 [Fomes fomentarius]|nr:hypothetical protein C8Q74DRAFT_1256335 [Fomes fomentarius]
MDNPSNNSSVSSSSQAALAERLPSLDSTFGALLIGSFVSVVLYGAGMHQVYRYFRLYTTDTIFIRTIVIVVMIMETLQVVFSIHANYYFLVSNYFNPVVLTTTVWSSNLIAVTGGVITTASQIFFLRRVSIISLRYKLVSAVASVFLAVKLAGDILLSYKGFTSKHIDAYANNQWMISLTFAALTVVNLLVTGSLIAVLRRARKGLKTNDSYVDMIVIWGLNTGLIVLVFDLMSLLLDAALQKTLYWVACTLVGARLYMNTLLSVLNTRKTSVSRNMDIFEAGSFTANIITRANRLAAAERWNVPQLPEEEPPSMIDIKVTTEIEDHGGSLATSVVSQHDTKQSSTFDLERNTL